MTGTLGVIGNVSRDRVSYPDGRRYVLIGGAALHIALAAHRAGMKASPIAVIGEDLVSPLMNPEVGGLDLSYIKVARGPSCTFRLEYGQDNHLTSAECDFGAAEENTAHALSVLGQHDWYHVCCRRPLKARLVLEQLVRRGACFSADFYLTSAANLIPAVVDFLPYAKTVFINAAEFGVLRTACDPHQLPGIVVSNGPHLACLLRHGCITATAQPPQAAVSEVTGAGDTLAGTFLAVAAAGLSDADALDAAVHAATRAIGSPGVAISGR